MKVDISENTMILDWESPLIIISESEFTKASMNDIQTAISMLCNIYCFEHTYDEIQHKAILSHLGKSRKGKILFGVIKIGNTEWLEICCITGNTIFPVLQYDNAKEISILYTRQKTQP